MLICIMLYIVKFINTYLQTNYKMPCYCIINLDLFIQVKFFYYVLNTTYDACTK